MKPRPPLPDHLKTPEWAISKLGSRERVVLGEAKDGIVTFLREDGDDAEWVDDLRDATIYPGPDEATQAALLFGGRQVLSVSLASGLNDPLRIDLSPPQASNDQHDIEPGGYMNFDAAPIRLSKESEARLRAALPVLQAAVLSSAECCQVMLDEATLRGFQVVPDSKGFISSPTPTDLIDQASEFERESIGLYGDGYEHQLAQRLEVCENAAFLAKRLISAARWLRTFTENVEAGHPPMDWNQEFPFR